MKELYILTEENATLHLSRGNSKLGKTIWNFSTIPGNADHRPIIQLHKPISEGYGFTGESAYVTNIVGTCSKHCEGCAKNGACYAWHSLIQHHNRAAKSWGDNTILLRNGKVFDLIDEVITKQNSKFNQSKLEEDKKVSLFRINQSGELENLAQLEGWNNLAMKHPEVQFSIYTKNYEVVEEFINKHGDTTTNFVINISQWHHVADKFLEKYSSKFNVFEYDDSNRKNNDLLEEDIKRLFEQKHCPAVLKNGTHAKTRDGENITCDMCGRCYRKTGEITAVYAH